MNLRKKAIYAAIPWILAVLVLSLAMAELNYQNRHNQWVDHVFQSWVK